MGLCDVCKVEVPEGTRFCPKCGLEMVTEKERTARRVPMETDVFDWNEDVGQPKDYAVSARQKPEEKAEQLVETLRLAETRLSEGRVLEAAAMLKRIRADVASRPKLRAWRDRLMLIAEDRKLKIRERCDRLTELRDGEKLCTLLAGSAANELEPEEVARVALTAARTFYDSRFADQAAELLRLPPFRTLREEALVAEHRALETIVHRRRSWQHWRKSVAVLGGVIIFAAVVLALVTAFAWHGSRTAGMSALLLIAGGTTAVVVLHKQIAAWFRERFNTDDPTEVVHELWQALRGRRR